MTIKRVAVIGAGISGLTAAYRLDTYARQGDVEVHVFEARPRAGGVMVTDTQHGAILEGGPDGFEHSKPEAEALCRELGLGDQLVEVDEAAVGAYVYHRRRLHPMPRGVVAGVPTELAALVNSHWLSPAARLRVLLDVVLPRRRDTGDHALGKFLGRRFGRQWMTLVAEPSLCARYGGLADESSSAAVVPQLLEVEHRYRSLILGCRALKRTGAATVEGEGALTLEGGLGQLVDAVDSALKQTLVHLAMPVAEIGKADEQGSQGYRLNFAHGASLNCDAILLAVPAHVAADLLRPVALEASSMLAAIEYTSLAVVAAIYDPKAIPIRLDRAGFYVPRGEGLKMTACTWMSPLWRQPSPGGVPLRLFFGRSQDGEDVTAWSDETFQEVVERELRLTMGIRQPPVYSRIFRWPKAVPQYRVGHPEHVWALRQALDRVPGVFGAGSIFQGWSVADCIRQSDQAAEAVRAYLGVKAD